MPYFVSRQHYYYQGDYAVEIAAGGLDYSGCDMLVNVYPGEGESYNDPREAVQEAVKILQAWKTDFPDLVIGLSYGYNLDMIEGEVIPSDGLIDGGEEYTEEEMKIIYDQALKEVIESANQWASKEYESLLKCDRCGEVIPNPDNYYYILDDPDYGKFCSENCADNAYYDYMKDNNLFEDEEE